MRSPFLFSALCLFLALVTPTRAQDGEASRQPAPDPAGNQRAAQMLEAAKGRIKKTGENQYHLGDIIFDSKSKEITFPATLNMADGLLEYAIVHENGKTHESLLSTKISPLELNLALLLTHYEPHVGEAAKFLDEVTPQTKAMMAKPMEKEGANRTKITVEWKDKEGKAQTAALNDWISNKATLKPMKVDYWVYTGSVIAETGFAAEFEGSILATYFDMVALINCPVPENASDEVWEVNVKAVPPLQTSVTVKLSPAVKK